LSFNSLSNFKLISSLYTIIVYLCVFGLTLGAIG